MKTTIGLADDCLIRQKPMQRGLTLPRATHKSVRGMSLRDALNFEIRCRRAVMATRHSRSKDKTLFDSHSRPTGKHCYLFVRTDNETPSVAMRIGNQDFSLKIAVTKPRCDPRMDARLVELVPTGGEWQYEPKWDGVRCLAFRDGDNIYLQSKAGQRLARYFPDIVANVAKLPQQQFILDGELVIPIGGALSFDELQLRLHPAASRVQKLAAAHPAVYIVFDLLAEDKKSYLKLPLSERRELLEKFARSDLCHAKDIRLSPATNDYDVAADWFAKTGRDLDGIIAKRLEAAYASGERTAAVKVKQLRTADCVVGGFRYATGKRVLGSLLLGLYGDDDLLHHIGFISRFKASELLA